MSQAIRELQSIRNAPDVEVAATACMLAAHEAAKVQDNDAIFHLQGKLDVSAPRAACLPSPAVRAILIEALRMLALHSWIRQVPRTAPCCSSRHTIGTRVPWSVRVASLTRCAVCTEF